MRTLKEIRRLAEEAPCNAVSTGAIAATGTTPPEKPANWGEPSPKKKVMLRRKAVNEDSFAGSKVFDVPSDSFHNARLLKKKGGHWAKYIGKGDHTDEIRKQARKKVSIILRDKSTGAMSYARK